MSPLLADAVEKGFCKSRRAILIQGQAQIRNLDSKNELPRFDNSKTQFHSSISGTFSTTSAHKRHWLDEGLCNWGRRAAHHLLWLELPGIDIATADFEFQPAHAQPNCWSAVGVQSNTSVICSMSLSTRRS